MTEKTELLFGFHSVHEALKAGRRDIHQLFISEKRSLNRFEPLRQLAELKKIPIDFVPPVRLEKISGSANHQGVAARAAALPVQNAAGITDRLKNKVHSCFLLVLESIEDPHNLGALIRTAVCAGVDMILIPKDRSARPSPAVSRSSAGAMEHADIFMMTNTASTLRRLKEHNVWISGLDGKGDTFFFDADLTGDIALVIGGEHKGIRPVVRKECDFLLSIPNLGKINSLNASVAGSIAMYEALRQRS